MMQAAQNSDAEAVELVRRNAHMDPRSNPDMILGPVKSLHRGRWAERTQLCAVGSRLLVYRTSRTRSFLGGVCDVEIRNGRMAGLTFFRNRPYQVRIQFGC